MRTYKQYLSASWREYLKAQREKTYSILVLKGNLWEVLWWINEREKVRFYQLGDL